MIREHVFFHGWFYPFRLHEEKSKILCNNYSSLNSFMRSAMVSCPNEFFKGGPRGSKLKLVLPIGLIPIRGHEVSQLAGLALNTSQEKTPHSKVQNFMLERDSKTIATEVPLWLLPEEMGLFSSLFNSSAPLTGHIDVLRIEDDNVWVWDFKPKAHKEKYAHTQVYFYSLMLCFRTGIPMEKIKCGYFDEEIAYVFEPSSYNYKQLI